MSFMQQILATGSWLANREAHPVDQRKRRLNAYNRAACIGGKSVKMPAEAADHVDKLEQEKVGLYGEKSNYTKVYDQKQVDFWRNHTYELADIILNRSGAFTDSSYADTGLAVNFFAA